MVKRKSGKRFDSAAAVTEEEKLSIEGNLRFDSKRYDDRGNLFIDAVVSTTGVLGYSASDTGGSGAEFVSRETLTNQNYLNSLKHAPVTARHPFVDGKQVFLNSKNIARFDRGIAVGEPVNIEEDGELRTKVPLMIKDFDTIAAVESRHLSQVSLGYERKRNFDKPGEYKGKRFDSTQENRLVNHIALEPGGRAGSKVGIRYDSICFDSQNQPETETDKNKNIIKEKKKMGEIDIDGTKVSTTDATGAALVNNKLKASNTAIIDLQTQLTAANTRFDSLTAELKTEQEKVKRFDSIDYMKAAKDRIKLENEAATVLTAGMKTEAEKTAVTARFDSTLSDTDLRKQVLTKIDSTVKFDGLEDSEIKGQYEATMKYQASDKNRYDAANKSFGNIQAIVAGISGDLSKPAASKAVDNITNKLAGIEK